MRQTVFASLIVLIFATLTAAQTQTSNQTRPSLSGVWKLNSQKSDLTDDRYALSRGEQGLDISESDKQIELTRHYSSGDFKATIYPDGRAASNRDANGEEFKSTSRWEGRKLISRYALHRSFNGAAETVDVIDEWTASSDGKTLTLNTTLRYLLRGTDAAHSAPFRGYVPRLWLKRVYERH
jgi:hypothetical protein